MQPTAIRDCHYDQDLVGSRCIGHGDGRTRLRPRGSRRRRRPGRGGGMTAPSPDLFPTAGNRPCLGLLRYNRNRDLSDLGYRPIGESPGIAASDLRFYCIETGRRAATTKMVAGSRIGPELASAANAASISRAIVWRVTEWIRSPISTPGMLTCKIFSFGS